MTLRTVEPRASTATAVNVAPTPNTQPRKQLWIAALKPPMYCVAIMPICVGSAVAYAEVGTLRWGVFLTFALSAILLLMWENLSNDVFDAETGIDINKHHSLVNLTRNRPLIFWIGNGCLLLGVLGICAIALQQQDPTVLYMVLACCALGYLYQGPPFRLGYQGLGELLCFLSFGPLAVGAAYYSQVQQFGLSSENGSWNGSWNGSGALLPACLLIGITTTLVLFCSHFHQVEDDLKAGKRSPIVRLGTWRGAQVLTAACGLILVTVLGAIATGSLPLTALGLIGSLPSAAKLCRHVRRFHDQPKRVSNAKFFAIHFHFWSGALLIASLLLSINL